MRSNDGVCQCVDREVSIDRYVPVEGGESSIVCCEVAIFML